MFNPWFDKEPGKGNGNPLHCCFEFRDGRGAWRTVIMRSFKELDTMSTRTRDEIEIEHAHISILN